MADNATPWMMFRNELSRFLLGDAGGGDLTVFKGLQTDTGVLPATWDNPKFGKWLGFQTADEIPIWGPVYRPSPGNRVTDQYHNFITNIDAPDATDQAAADKARELRGSLNDLQKQVSETRLRIGPAWAIFNASQQGIPPDFQLTFEQWFAIDFGAQLSTLQADYDNVAGQWAIAANQAGGGYQALGQALQDYNNPAFQTKATDNNGATLDYRSWSLLPPLEDFVAEAKAGQGSALQIDINTHTDTTNITESSWDANVGFNFGIFGIGGGGGQDHLTVDTTTQDFSMSFSSPAFTGITVRPGQWFHQDVILLFKDGPFFPEGPFGPGKAVFFGEQGVYSLQKTIIYVAYQPVVTATLDETTYSRVRDSWQASGGLSIGPFSFGGGAGGAQDDATFTDNTRTVKVTSSSPHPQIVATLSAVMPGL